MQHPTRLSGHRLDSSISLSSLPLPAFAVSLLALTQLGDTTSDPEKKKKNSPAEVVSLSLCLALASGVQSLTEHRLLLASAPGCFPSTPIQGQVGSLLRGTGCGP